MRILVGVLYFSLLSFCFYCSFFSGRGFLLDIFVIFCLLLIYYITIFVLHIKHTRSMKEMAESINLQISLRNDIERYNL
jgi:hypothetical protein